MKGLITNSFKSNESSCSELPTNAHSPSTLHYRYMYMYITCTCSSHCRKDQHLLKPERRAARAGLWIYRRWPYRDRFWISSRFESNIFRLRDCKGAPRRHCLETQRDAKSTLEFRCSRGTSECPGDSPEKNPLPTFSSSSTWLEFVGKRIKPIVGTKFHSRRDAIILYVYNCRVSNGL